MGHYIGGAWNETDVTSVSYNSGTRTYTGTSSSFSPFGGVAGGFVVVLSAELTSIKATAKNGTNLITFTTANEVNLKGFQIERSATGTDGTSRDNREGWSTIGDMKAKGASDYTFTDANPLVISYYRVRANDLDGKSTVSKIVSVNGGKGKLAILSVYPNPAKEATTVDFETASTGTAVATVKDITGKVILLKNIAVTEGVNQLTLDMSFMAGGVYILNISDKAASVVQRIIKQ